MNAFASKFVWRIRKCITGVHRAEIDDNCALHIMHCLLLVYGMHYNPQISNQTQKRVRNCLSARRPSFSSLLCWIIKLCCDLLSRVVLNWFELSWVELPAGDKSGLPDYKSRKWLHEVWPGYWIRMVWIKRGFPADRLAFAILDVEWNERPGTRRGNKI